jgi:tetratricopeptide (TPR) repeat protein
MQHEFSDRFENFDDADVKASVERFEEMLKSKETLFFDEETYEQLSEYYLLKSRWDMAMKACRMGLQQYPYSLELLLDKVQLHANYEQFDEAMEVLDKAAIFNPSDNEITYMRGVISNLMGNYEEAIEHLREALLLSDEKETVYFQLAQTYQNWQKFAEAAHFYKKAIRHKFHEEIAFYELVFCLEQANKLEENLSYFKELVDNDPYSHFAWFALGMMHSRLGKHEDAAFSYDYAVTIKEDFS